MGKRNDIESPCVKICVVEPESRLCTGCLRSTREIAMWSRMSADERRGIMAELPERASKLTRRRGGRRGRVERSGQGRSSD